MISPDGDIEINAGRDAITLNVRNTGDRAAQVGSHYHFFEANKCLEFDRAVTVGYRLDIPAGTAVRFEPGSDHDVTLVRFAGTGRIVGFSGLVNGGLDSAAAVRHARQRSVEAGFGGATDPSSTGPSSTG
ncbi:MAG: urease subunit beta [Acidimicrobiales bacterium]